MKPGDIVKIRVGHTWRTATVRVASSNGRSIGLQFDELRLLLLLKEDDGLWHDILNGTVVEVEELM